MNGEREPMELGRFRTLVDAYGSTPERWPDDERDEALALLATSAEAQVLRHEAERLDSALDQIPELAPSPALMARILAESETPPRTKSRWFDILVETIWPGARLWQPLGAFASAAALGLLLGFSQVAGGPVGASDAFAGVDLDAFAFADVDDEDLSL